jgi:signal transduction histidine kinase
MMVTNAARFGTEKALEPLRRVNAAGTHLLSLINEILDLSKIEAGKLDLNLEPVNLSRLIDEVIGTAGQLAEKNKNRLIVEAQDNVGALTADRAPLRRDGVWPCHLAQARAHDGWRRDSCKPGKGSVFTVRLPGGATH